MARIEVLDAALANQIAAGEVVERPASAVKELLENALDAGATQVTVEVAEGGVRLLRVVDNGYGMTPEDAALAVRRHATSKVRVTADLMRISTLGFRGEALPSIAAVSRFRLRTRAAGAVGATEVRIEGGASPELRDAAGPQGTEVRVEDLFYNIPARRKFLKKPATETAHVHEAIHRLALGHPHVGFRFIKDERTAIDLPPHADLMQRVRAIFGARIADDLRPVHAEGDYGITGLIGPADQARSTPRHYYTFVNGRYVRDRVIMSAAQQAYGHLLPRGKHPFVVLHLTIPLDAVDQNVHPAKTEVRFADTRVIHRLVSRAMSEAINAANAPAPAETSRSYALDPGGAPTTTPSDPGLSAHRQRIFDAMERLGGRQGLPAMRAPSVGGRRSSGSDGQGMRLPLRPPPERLLPGRLTPEAPPRTPIGQVGDLLLVALQGAIEVIDMPSARAALARRSLTTLGVPLSPPVSVELGTIAQTAFGQRRPVLETIGFEIEPFGGRTLVIKRAPSGLPGLAAAGLLPALLQAAEEGEVPHLCAAEIARHAAPLAEAERSAFLRRFDALPTSDRAPCQAVWTLTELAARMGSV
ncbi:MAG: DNA mismatch repair protein MutL [Bradymonadia bacterium]|jgi:DNA mismatch repair protein MutL